jgi:hypothetical protein
LLEVVMQLPERLGRQKILRYLTPIEEAGGGR